MKSQRTFYKSYIRNWPWKSDGWMLLTYWNAFLKKTNIVEYTTWFLYLACASLSKLLMYLQRSFIRCKISPRLLRKRDKKNSGCYTDSKTKGKNAQWI